MANAIVINYQNLDASLVHASAHCYRPSVSTEEDKIIKAEWKHTRKGFSQTQIEVSTANRIAPAFGDCDVFVFSEVSGFRVIRRTADIASNLYPGRDYVCIEIDNYRNRKEHFVICYDANTFKEFDIGAKSAIMGLMGSALSSNDYAEDVGEYGFLVVAEHIPNKINAQKKITQLQELSNEISIAQETASINNTVVAIDSNLANNQVVGIWNDLAPAITQNIATTAKGRSIDNLFKSGEEDWNETDYSTLYQYYGFSHRMLRSSFSCFD